MNKRERKKYYQSLLPYIREEAKKCGYAITVHGSMMRDMDLVAIPWIDKALTQKTLVRRICKVTSGLLHYSIGEKPHGRKAYIIILKNGGEGHFIEKDGRKSRWGVFIDLSIMPKSN